MLPFMSNYNINSVNFPKTNYYSENEQPAKKKSHLESSIAKISLLSEENRIRKEKEQEAAPRPNREPSPLIQQQREELNKLKQEVEQLHVNKLEKEVADLKRAVLFKYCRSLCEPKTIFWMPHPLFTEDQGPFPEKAVNILDPHLYGFKTLGHIFQEKRFKVLAGGMPNEFFKWLNSDDELSMLRKVENGDEIFMNCVDFVYFALYTSDLLSKEEIAKIYQNFRSDAVNKQGSNRWCGFKLKDFKEITKTDYPIVGDIILCINREGEPIHALIKGEKDKAFGLWNRPSYSVSETSLNALVEMQRDSKGATFTYQYCPLEKFLKELK